MGAMAQVRKRSTRDRGRVTLPASPLDNKTKASEVRGLQRGSSRLTGYRYPNERPPKPQRVLGVEGVHKSERGAIERSRQSVRKATPCRAKVMGIYVRSERLGVPMVYSQKGVSRLSRQGRTSRWNANTETVPLGSFHEAWVRTSNSMSGGGFGGRGHPEFTMGNGQTWWVRMRSITNRGRVMLPASPLNDNAKASEVRGL
ncbi:hypothetical protein EXIGLDRAFT_27524 [Exidia glandulosa HHB12029]|uniref:Uncharacterized protein n=1 Tax=Exidia glandulosa HHB12029 TaxID=1314781 RepID=A0A165P941_EXIGL|nr:hypothetical protein EXIGLDRAFT_27524 [Exidia glandulosa HHB12029]